MDKTVALAQDLLANRFGGAPEFTSIEDLEGRTPGRVIRARLSSNPFIPQRSIIIKHSDNRILDDGTLGNTAQVQSNFLKEVASYQFTNLLSKDLRPGPVLLAYDEKSYMLILTDLGASQTFAEIFAKDSARQEGVATTDIAEKTKTYLKLAKALGRMHSATAHAEQDFNALLARRSPSGVSSVHAETVDFIHSAVQKVHKTYPELPEDEARLLDQLPYFFEEGIYTAFSPYDLSPENIVVGEEVHFLDFEWAGFRDATFDLACAMAGFPHGDSGHVIPGEQVPAFLAAWASEVKDTWPGIEDSEEFQRAMINSLLGWILLGHAPDFSTQGRKDILSALDTYLELYPQKTDVASSLAHRIHADETMAGR